MKVNLALQGGGAHGAFTWGVLDRLLEAGRFGFDGISGASAGAVNAVALAHGWRQGGRDGARATLAQVWEAVAAATPFEFSTVSPDGTSVRLGPLAKLAVQAARYLGPAQLNPFDRNPLRDVLERHIDFEALRTASPFKLFVSATRADSGRLRVLRERELDVDAVLASACVPQVHRAVEIDGHPYWDGAFSGNPAVHPLFFDCHAHDIVLVLLTPLDLGPPPARASEIQQRALEIAFNASFLREMRLFADLGERFRASRLPLGRFEQRVLRTFFHVIDAEDVIASLPADSRLAVNQRFFHGLRDLGRERAGHWLRQHGARVGQGSSVDLQARFG